ncbi:sigma-54 interaction domain-containing protein [Peredibacter starrii]|uniref:Sigma 54-interacting transcriptional regulator n=1 Tax=Peredibacter starrii TaxID=28202 RepID=A0AAX4HPM1_9BACT|nr:sigma 54-interacting transcriptional regulator [Peredibacter starrii]WPU65227.1 sigma 54-interacting transcriptional regulator [Peredibacter starrii]
MIDWKAIKDLHTTKSLEKIVGNWYGLDVLYVDTQGRVQFVQEPGYSFKSPFLKLQMSHSFGHDWLEADVEKVFEFFNSSSEMSYEFDAFFPGTYGYSHKVVVDDEFCGVVIAYPYFKDTSTTEEVENVVKKVVECGIGQEDAKVAVSKIKKFAGRFYDEMKELVAIVADEVGTFHHEISKREARIMDLNSEIGNKYRYHNLIGKSKKMQQVYHLLSKVSNSESTIMIQGENGTGKEMVAKAIHYNSPRKDAVFMAVNCSAFNDNLLDSELFGHVKGAFTGAIKDKKGVFEVANGGTLFLDEIGDTSPSMQVKLLRILQEGTFMPVGATQPKKVNVRVVAATNKNLKEMIAKGEFREDLYYRINVINVALPPLRERQEDIPVLMDFFLQKRCEEAGLPLKTFSKKCLEKMLDHTWPGNVRELQNEVERLVVIAGEDKNITPDMLSSRILESGESHGHAPSHSGGSFLKGVNTNGSLKDALEELEILMIREGLKRCAFNKSKLAKELGISRAGLIMKVEKYGLDKRAQKRAAGE